MRNLYKSLAILSMIMMLLFACSTEDAPAEAAEKWYEAATMLEALKADALVCNEKRQEFRRDMETGSALFLFGQSLLGNQLDIELDTTNMEFTTLYLGSESAVVSVDGEIRAAVGGRIHNEFVNDRWVMALEEEEWRWCGEYENGAEASIAPNPSFEEGESSPLGWKSNVLCGSATLAWDDSKTFSGDRALKIENVQPDDCDESYAVRAVWESDPIPVNPAHNYSVSFWYFNGIQNGASYSVERVDGEGMGRDWILKYSRHLPTTVGKWKPAHITISSEDLVGDADTVPIESVRLQLWVLAGTSDQDAIWIDDLVVKDLGASE